MAYHEPLAMAATMVSTASDILRELVGAGLPLLIAPFQPEPCYAVFTAVLLIAEGQMQPTR